MVGMVGLGFGFGRGSSRVRPAFVPPFSQLLPSLKTEANYPGSLDNLSMHSTTPRSSGLLEGLESPFYSVPLMELERKPWRLSCRS